MQKTREQKIDLIYQKVVGIESNPDDNGMVGDLKAIKTQLTILNGQVRKNTTFRVIGTWVSCALATGIIAIAIEVICNSGV